MSKATFQLLAPGVQRAIWEMGWKELRPIQAEAIQAVFGGENIIPIAAIITGLLFLGLTVTAFTTRKDFSFLGPILCVSGCS